MRDKLLNLCLISFSVASAGSPIAWRESVLVRPTFRML